MIQKIIVLIYFITFSHCFIQWVFCPGSTVDIKDFMNTSYADVSLKLGIICSWNFLSHLESNTPPNQPAQPPQLYLRAAVQVLPSELRVNPELHKHLKLPAVLSHLCAHPPLFMAHSFTSEGTRQWNNYRSTIFSFIKAGENVFAKVFCPFCL